jgi:ParB family chromosome partitioning protein
MTVERFPLDQIAPNPFQTRQAEDPADVARLAESIAQVGLLQIPVGRRDKDKGVVQLAFGHTRLAAFKALTQEAHADPKTERWDYDQMPVDVRALTDLAMFELAIRENVDRKDLTPIEEARAMATYRDQFSKTSDDIGELFGLSGSAVRNKMRLLELPASVQERVQAGEIQEGAARRLLALNRIAPQAIEKVAEDLVKNKVETSEAIFQRVADVLNEQAFLMGANRYYRAQADEEDDDDGKGRAGTGLWPLTWKGGVQAPTPAALLKLLEAHGRLASDEIEPAALAPYIAALASGTDVAGVVKLYGIGEELAAWIGQFVAPPPCSSCEFHQVLDGAHYCGIKACWEQKRKAWISAETARLSRKLGIPVYDPGGDGKAFVKAPTRWIDSSEALDPAWQKMLEAKDKSLRLKGTTPDYRPHAGTKSYVVELVRVGKPAEQAKAADKRRNRQAGGQHYDYAAEERKRREAQKRGDASMQFLEREATPLFAPLLKGLDSPGILEVLAMTTGRKYGPWRKKLPAKKAARCATLRGMIVFDLLQEELTGHDVRRKGPAATAKHLQGVAQSLGVKLPVDWLKRAEALEPKAQGVSTETDEEE